MKINPFTTGMYFLLNIKMFMLHLFDCPDHFLSESDSSTYQWMVMFLNLAYLKRHYVVFEKKFKLRILMISILMLIPTHKYDSFFHK